MKTLYSKKYKSKKNKDKNKLCKYWNLLYPKEYSSKLVGKKCFVDNGFKFASSERPKEEQLFGVLKQTEDGYAYLEIDDSIFSFLNLIQDDNSKISKPPVSNGVKAHISVIKDEEAKDKNIKLKELNDRFPFYIKGFYSVNPDGWDEVKKVWMINVESKELEDLRKSYGLTRLINDNHEFHITVAVEKE